jgi:hypothetical protein
MVQGEKLGLKYGDDVLYWEAMSLAARILTGHLLENDLCAPEQFAHLATMCLQVQRLVQCVGEEHVQSFVEWLPAHQAHLSWEGSLRAGHAFARWPND